MNTELFPTELWHRFNFWTFLRNWAPTSELILWYQRKRLHHKWKLFSSKYKQKFFLFIISVALCTTHNATLGIPYSVGKGKVLQKDATWEVGNCDILYQLNPTFIVRQIAWFSSNCFFRAQIGAGAPLWKIPISRSEHFCFDELCNSFRTLSEVSEHENKVRTAHLSRLGFVKALLPPHQFVRAQQFY